MPFSFPAIFTRSPLPTASRREHDSERQPLLPAQEHGHAIAHAASEQPGRPVIHTSPLHAYRTSQFGRLWHQYTHHGLIQENGRPNFELARRMLHKLLFRTGLISVDAAANVAAGVIAGLVSRAILTRFTSHDASVLQEAVLNSVRFLVDRQPAAMTGRALGVDEKTALGLLFLAVYHQQQSGGQGMEFALATQLAGGTTAAVHAFVDLVRQLYPTRSEDLKAVYDTIIARDGKLIETMPEDRRYSVMVLRRELEMALVAPARRGKEVDGERVRELIEALDAHLHMWKSMCARPVNIWGYDTTSPEDVRKRERINFLEKRLSQQVSRDKNSQKAVETFIERMRMQRSSKWDPDAHGDSMPKLNVLLGVGGPGTGKTYLGKLLVELSGEDGVEVGFKYLVGYMAPPDEADKRGGTSISPFKAHSQFFNVMMKSRTALVICNEADLIGKGGEGMGTNQGYVDAVKRAFDPAGPGIITLESEPRYSNYIVDLRSTSFYITSNHAPTDPAIIRRFCPIEITGIPLPARREIARSTVEECLRNTIPAYFALSPEQTASLRREMANLMEFIIDKSLEDAGPSNMKVAIGDVLRYMARAYMDGTRNLAPASSGDDLLAGVPDPDHGPSWPQVSESDIDLELRNVVDASFKKYREGSAILNMLDAAKEKLEALDRQGMRRPAELPTVEEYLASAEEAKLSAKDTILFVDKALQQQWKEAIDNMPPDARRFAEKLSTAAKNSLTYLNYVDAAAAKSNESYMNAEFFLKFLDRLARTPLQRKNLSHWEAGGDVAQREKIHQALESIEGLFDSDVNKRRVSELLRSYIDSTVPLPPGQDAPDPALKGANTLVITGPAGAGKDFLAREIVSRLGLRAVQMTIPRFLAIMRNEKVKDAPQLPNCSVDEALGPCSELLQGDGDAVLVFSGEELAQLSDADKSELNRLLSPNALNPSITLRPMGGVSFRIDVAGLLKIFTMREQLDDEQTFSNARSITIGTLSPEMQRESARQIFAAQVAGLDKFDIPPEARRRIVDACGSMMDYVISENNKIEGGPALLQRVFAGLFAVERNDFQKRVMERGKQRADAPARPATPGTPPGSREPAQTSAPLEHLIAYVDSVFADHRQALTKRRAAAGARAEDKPKAVSAPAGRPVAAPSQARPSGSAEIAGLLARLDPEQLREAIRTLAETTGTDERVPAGQQSIRKFFRPALMDAVSAGDLKRVKEMLKSFGRLTLLQHRNTEGETVLHVAARLGKLEVLELLLADGRALTAMLPDAGGRTPLHAAAAAGQGGCAQRLMEAAPGQLAARDNDGNSVLHLAATRGDETLVDLLLKDGRVNPTLQNNAGEVAAAIALKNGNPDLARRLLG